MSRIISKGKRTSSGMVRRIEASRSTLSPFLEGEMKDAFVASAAHFRQDELSGFVRNEVRDLVRALQERADDHCPCGMPQTFSGK